MEDNTQFGDSRIAVVHVLSRWLAPRLQRLTAPLRNLWRHFRPKGTKQPLPQMSNVLGANCGQYGRQLYDYIYDPTLPLAVQPTLMFVSPENQKTFEKAWDEFIVRFYAK